MIEENALKNIELHEGFVLISVNPKLYPLSVIYAAAYAMLDRVHVIIDGDPETEILVELRAKSKDEDLKEIAYCFNDELINYSIYTIQAARNKKLRETIVENALRGNLRDSIPLEADIADPEGIKKVKTPRKEEISDKKECLS